jgi:hypothetical protein
MSEPDLTRRVSYCASLHSLIQTGIERGLTRVFGVDSFTSIGLSAW